MEGTVRTFFAIGIALPVLALAVLLAAPAVAQTGPPTATAIDQPAVPKRILAQQEAMKALNLSDGDWRGPSKVLRKNGWVDMVETQRVATLLDGTVRTIESRGYEADGSLGFSMLAVISWDPDAKAYSMRSWSNGRVRDYPMKVSADGFSWEFESSPGMTIRYEAAVKNSVWTQTATRVPAEGKPETYLEFAVKRVRNAANPVLSALAK
jgi:hypothetical protein